MSAPASSVSSVVVALAANSFVTVIKFAAFALSGSGAMLSEAIHSLADTGNQLLLFIGLKRGARAQDDEFHYGYGGERFIFGMLSASGIFFVGCGVTLYHGVSALLTPHQPALGVSTFVVLGVAFVVESGAFLFALRAALKQRAGMPFGRYLREKADPATLAILLEDGAAVLGMVLASAGITAAWFTGNPLWDALASIVVGVLLGFVAVFLVIENRELLLGKAVPEGVEQKFLEILKRPSLRGFHDVKTRQLTPEAYKFKAEIIFDERFLAERLSALLPAEAPSLNGAEREPTLLRVAALTTRIISDEIDAIEAATQKAIPEVKHIDLELDAGPAK